MTKEQKKLKKKHGTPKEFAEAVWVAWGDLWCTYGEAITAIRKYEEEWCEAGRKSK